MFVCRELNGACGVEALLGRVVSGARFDSHDFARDGRAWLARWLGCYRIPLQTALSTFR